MHSQEVLFLVQISNEILHNNRAAKKQTFTNKAVQETNILEHYNQLQVPKLSLTQFKYIKFHLKLIVKFHEIGPK